MAKDVCIGEISCPKEVQAFMKVPADPALRAEKNVQAFLMRRPACILMLSFPALFLSLVHSLALSPSLSP